MTRSRINKPIQKKRYHYLLHELISFLHGSLYPKDKQFTTQELSRLQPHDIFRWMAMKVYDINNPNDQDHPTEGWPTLLKYYKKAQSYFMPNCCMQWNKISKCGNPSRSNEVNNLISVVMKKEVKKLGKATQADRPFEKP
eukprot:14070842-Ditylum_brightwellii.AAC.1